MSARWVRLGVVAFVSAGVWSGAAAPAGADPGGAIVAVTGEDALRVVERRCVSLPRVESGDRPVTVVSGDAESWYLIIFGDEKCATANDLVILDPSSSVTLTETAGSVLLVR